MNGKENSGEKEQRAYLCGRKCEKGKKTTEEKQKIEKIREKKSETWT